MNYVFLVQGEGRGHMSQAIALYGILKKNGHEVSAVLAGKSPRRQVPAFFYAAIPTGIIEYDSPNFLPSKNRKGIRVFSSIVYNLLKAPRYIRSLKLIKKKVKAANPDVIINFYDLMGGLYKFFNRKTKMVCIGHQFLISHPEVKLPEGRRLENWLMRLHNAAVSYKTNKKLALSFRPLSKKHDEKIAIVPPLLRQEIRDAAENGLKDSGYLLGYLLNDGFAEEATDWHQANKQVTGRFFWDRNGADQETRVLDNLTFHLLDDKLFIKYLAHCGMYAGTAGFESLCEAMYLGKPFLCAPSENHYEQAFNAIDATAEGAGIWDSRLNLDRLLVFKQAYRFDNKPFRAWADSAEKAFLRHLVDSLPR